MNRRKDGEERRRKNWPSLVGLKCQGRLGEQEGEMLRRWVREGGGVMSEWGAVS